MTRAAAMTLATLLLLTGCLALVDPNPEAEPRPAAHWDARVASFDGVDIAVTVFRPEGASEASPVPVILHGHGWSGSRATAPEGFVGTLQEAGFGVVSIDARGHGESGGVATVMHRDVEVRDYSRVLDWIHDELDWVQRDPDAGVGKNVVAGATGGSYGGGFQLVTASHDARLNALAPEFTWHDLTYSLAPHGVVKSVWVHALYGMAYVSGTRLHEDVDRWYAEAMTTNALPEDARRHFEGASPDPRNVTADVLLVQGIPDALFNLNEATWTFEALAARETGEARLFTHLDGHVLPGVQPIGLGGERASSPCGDVHDLVLAWFDWRLRNGPDPGIPVVSYALDDGSGCIELDALPGDDVLEDVTLPVPLVALQGAGTLLVPLAEGPAVIAGIPQFTARATAPTTAIADGILHVGLAVAGPSGDARVVDDQATAVRVTETGDLAFPLAGVAVRLAEGDRLLLRVDGLNEWFASNGSRLPGGLVLEDVTVRLPVLDA